jgi:oxygen-independent coproporphyrinogen-3 oxidase
MPACTSITATSLYVHVPFCAVKCGYCDFNSYVIEDPSAHDLYLAALGAELRHGRIARNDEDDDRAMFVRTRELLGGAGFEAYEVSNFAGRGGPCRHNEHYWLQGDYVGVGPGANSHRAGVRTANLKPLDAWARSAISGVVPVASAETLTPRQRGGEAVWLGLRRRDGIDLAEVEARIGYPVRTACAPLTESQQRSGWLLRDGDRIRLTEAGLLLADAAGSAYLATSEP